MIVDSYKLLDILRSILYCAGEANEAARTIDSQHARSAFLEMSGNLKNAAEDVMGLFDSYEDNVKFEVKGGRDR